MWSDITFLLRRCLSAFLWVLFSWGLIYIGCVLISNLSSDSPSGKVRNLYFVRSQLSSYHSFLSPLSFLSPVQLVTSIQMAGSRNLSNVFSVQSTLHHSYLLHTLTVSVLSQSSICNFILSVLNMSDSCRSPV